MVKVVSGQRQLYLLKTIFWLIAILLGWIQVWVYRNILSSDDAIVYLDIGDAILRGDWKTAITGYWSPLYGLLLALVASILKPSAYWEFFTVKITNFLLYLFALLTFDRFLGELIFYYNQKIDESPTNSYLKIPNWVWVTSGYLLFLWSSLKWLPLYNDTPDIFTTALIYLASAILLRLHTRSANWVNFILLGVILGFASLSKAAMFPISLIFLSVSAFSTKNFRRTLPKVFAALLAFILVTAPFIGALSLSKGRFTIGDSGKLNYAWRVIGGVQPFRYWQGKEPGWGTPEHPPRRIFDNPEVLEFATPVGGTYPLWHDPSYWYQGLKFQSNPLKQIVILGKNILFYYRRFLGGLFFGYLILAFASGQFWSLIRFLRESWRLLFIAISGLGAYSLVADMQVVGSAMQPSLRYVAPFVVLLFAGVFSSVRLPNSQESKRLVVGMTVATLVLLGIQFYDLAAKNIETIVNRPGQHLQWKVADRLQELGLEPGDKVAIFGTYFYPDFHWARLARVQIISELRYDESFWDKDPQIRSEVLEKIKQTGVRAIVQKPGLEIPDSALVDGWQKVGDTGYYAYFFERASQ